MHLFRVAAGLDSLVPGEGEILGQVRDAFEAGATGPLLDRTLPHGTPRRTPRAVETAIGESPSSVPAAAAALAQQVFEGPRRATGWCSSAPVARRLTARISARAERPLAAVVNRTVERAERLASSLGAQAMALDDVAAALEGADVVVSSTSSPGFVLTVDVLGPALRARRGKPVLFVDLAVPRDVDPSLASIDGCFVYDVDDLEAVVSTSLDGRRAEAVAAERIVAAEAERFHVWQASLAVVPAIASLRAQAEEIRASELARVEARLGRLTESERAMVDTVTAQIVAKLLHLPTVRMKEAAVTADGLIYAEVVRHLFGLGEEGEA